MSGTLDGYNRQSCVQRDRSLPLAIYLFFYPFQVVFAGFWYFFSIPFWFFWHCFLIKPLHVQALLLRCEKHGRAKHRLSSLAVLAAWVALLLMVISPKTGDEHMYAINPFFTGV